jgi:hypothetical protein
MACGRSKKTFTHWAGHFLLHVDTTDVPQLKRAALSTPLQRLNNFDEFQNAFPRMNHQIDAGE